jgi:IS30 family transposase
VLTHHFPKGISFETITDEQVEAVMHRLNHRPRKGLNYQTPHAVFSAQAERKAV